MSSSYLVANIRTKEIVVERRQLVQKNRPFFRKIRGNKTHEEMNVRDGIDEKWAEGLAMLSLFPPLEKDVRC